MINIPVPPWRRDFDCARDPYTARNALGITGTGGGGGAPTSAEYVTSSADATLTNERVLTDTATVTWDFSTPGQAKANASSSGGVSEAPNDGNVYGRQSLGWANLGLLYQPKDGDLTAIAALTGTNTIYYRSAADTWTPVTIGTGLSFSAGTLANTVSTSGLQPLDSTLTALAAFNTNGLLTQTAADTFTGRTLTGPAAGITVSNGNGVAGNPTLALADDLAALEALSGTSTIYYRSGASAWTAVTIGAGLSFSSGTLAGANFTTSAAGDVPASGGGTTNFLRADGTWTTPAGGGNVSNSGTPTSGQMAIWTDATHIQGVTRINPTRQIFFSGSGTYTTPAGCIAIDVECIGGGGGGQNGNLTAGSNGGATTFGSSFMSAGGGTAGGAGSTGGTASGGDIGVKGGDGNPGCPGQSTISYGTGGAGGNSFYGGGGRGGYADAGQQGGPNTGSGGGGGSRNVDVAGQVGAGGGAGGYCRKLISSPASTYSYVVGAAGSGAGTGSTGYAGGAGGAGLIVVTEFY